MLKQLNVCAAAKLNLYLGILGQRSDAYHELETIFCSIDLYDRLTFRLQERGENKIHIHLASDSAYTDLALGPDNLICRAAQAFFGQLGLAEAYDLSVELDKRIPIAAGLAGGSADAAATLYALNALLDRPFSTDQLLAIAAELGADVPFCLLGGLRLGRGRGELLSRPISERRFRLLCVLPPGHVQLSTAAVFGRYNELGEEKSQVSVEEFTDKLQNSPAAELSTYNHNSLKNAAMALCPWLSQVFTALQDMHLPPLLSGSGPTVFAFLPELASESAILSELRGMGYNACIHNSVNHGLLERTS